MLYDIGMEMLIQINEDFLRPRIKVVLSRMGFCERYQAFDYLVEIIFDLIKNEDENSMDYNSCLNKLAQTFEVSAVSVAGGIGALLNSNKNILNKLGVSNKQNFYRIKIIKNYVVKEIEKRFEN